MDSRKASTLFQRFFFQEPRMKSRDRRHFVRVDMQQEVFLDFDTKSSAHSLGNLSLGGIFVNGCVAQQPGDTCLIRLRQPQGNAEITAQGTVIRVSEQGVALKFTAMTIDSLFFLQTMLLDETSDSLVLGESPVEYITIAD
jgi:hypothetical protein